MSAVGSGGALSWKEPWIEDLNRNIGRGEKWFPLVHLAVTSFFNKYPNYRSNPAAYAFPFDWERTTGRPVNENYVVDFNRKWDRDSKEDLALDVHKALLFEGRGGPITLRYQTILAKIDLEEKFVTDQRPGPILTYWLHTAIKNMLEKRREGSVHQRLFSTIADILSQDPYSYFGELHTCGRNDDDIVQELGRQAFGIDGESVLRPLTRRNDLRRAAEMFRLIPRERASVTSEVRQRNSRIFNPAEIRSGMREIVRELQAAVTSGFMMQAAERGLPELLPVIKADESWDHRIRLVGNIGDDGSGIEDEQMFDGSQSDFEDGEMLGGSKSEPSQFTTAVESESVVTAGFDPLEVQIIEDLVKQVLVLLTESEMVCFANQMFGSAKNQAIATRAGLDKVQYVSRERSKAEIKIKNTTQDVLGPLEQRLKSDGAPASDIIDIKVEVLRRIHSHLLQYVIRSD